VIAFNLIGLPLLVNVARIAALPSPVPFRSYLQGPPVLLAFHLPYGFIAPFCVGRALFGQRLVFRWPARAGAPTTIKPATAQCFDRVLPLS